MGYPEFDEIPAGRRRFIAQNMKFSKAEKPHAYSAIDIDISELELIRKEEKASFEEENGASLRLDLFFMWWLIRAAEALPILNSCYIVDKEKKQHNIRFYKSINLGVAVAHKDLITIAIKDAEKKSFAELAKLLEVIYKTSTVESPQKILTPELEINASTITFNNAGGLKIPYGASVIEPAASLILTIHRARNLMGWKEEPLGGRIIPYPAKLVYSAVSFDHCPVDGRPVACLLNFLKEKIESRENILELINNPQKSPSS